MDHFRNDDRTSFPYMKADAQDRTKVAALCQWGKLSQLRVSERDSCTDNFSIEHEPKHHRQVLEGALDSLASIGVAKKGDRLAIGLALNQKKGSHMIYVVGNHTADEEVRRRLDQFYQHVVANLQALGRIQRRKRLRKLGSQEQIEECYLATTFKDNVLEHTLDRSIHAIQKRHKDLVSFRDRYRVACRSHSSQRNSGAIEKVDVNEKWWDTFGTLIDSLTHAGKEVDTLRQEPKLLRRMMESWFNTIAGLYRDKSTKTDVGGTKSNVLALVGVTFGFPKLEHHLRKVVKIAQCISDLIWLFLSHGTAPYLETGFEVQFIDPYRGLSHYVMSAPSFCQKEWFEVLYSAVIYSWSQGGRQKTYPWEREALQEHIFRTLENKCQEQTVSDPHHRIHCEVSMLFFLYTVHRPQSLRVWEYVGCSTMVCHACWKTFEVFREMANGERSKSMARIKVRETHGGWEEWPVPDKIPGFEQHQLNNMMAKLAQTLQLDMMATLEHGGVFNGYNEQRVLENHSRREMLSSGRVVGGVMNRGRPFSRASTL